MLPRATAFSLLFLPVVAAGAAAEELPVSWSYRNPLAEIAFADGTTGGLTFPNTVFQSLTGSADITATRVSSYSIAPDTARDRITSLPYNFALDLRDDLSGEVARLSFAGVFSGDLWRTGSALTAKYTGPADQTVTLGGNRYTVALGGFAAPSGYGDDAAGSISARVSIAGLGPPPVDPPVDPSSGPPGSVNTPEPATALLALAGLPAAGAVRAVRRRTALRPVQVG